MLGLVMIPCMRLQSRRIYVDSLALTSEEVQNGNNIFASKNKTTYIYSPKSLLDMSLVHRLFQGVAFASVIKITRFGAVF
ncbi:hypothetical protein Lalb_Chr04g0255781 [Lupinus albus]|uniref:Uncharacterized protein n=1 Tax=Lupinus albus TaxID=3870 RepID=A0A6A4QME9_LUPAL|nr:hypothetical protein Lalb_Chr04g0255781 [Lupinus albus]